MNEVRTARYTVAVPFDLSQGQDRDFCNRLEEAAGQGPHRLYLDCTDLSPVNSSHIGLLWKAKEICRQKSIEVILENVNDRLIRTLQALDLTDVFEINVACDRQPNVPRTKPPSDQGKKQHVGDFGAEADGVDQALYEFMEILEQWRLDEEARFDLRTLFYELATNIRCHSGLPPEARIQYRAVCANGELQLVFEDNGKPFNPLSLPDDFDPRVAARKHQARGFGISLIRRLADDIQYTRKDNITNVLCLTKHYGDG